MFDNEPRLYAVSSGNGNDGVSHMFPDYYVMTNDPYRLATLAMVSGFKKEFKEAALDACEVDGEAGYTVSATIYNPEDVDPSEAPAKECDCGWKEGDDTDHEEDCASLADDDEYESWSSVNGAWQIIEVFPDDEPRDSTMQYDSIEDAFSDEDLAFVPVEETA